jgi:hypothetical protein
MGTPRIDLIDKNLLINGNMDYWQRSTSVALTGTFGYQSVDRWGGWASGGGSPVISRSTQVPNADSQYSMRLTGATSTTGTRMIQRVESRMIAPHASSKVTLSVWVYNNTGSSTTFGYSIQVPASADTHNAGSDTIALAANFSQTAANGVWTKLSATIDMSTVANASRGIALWLYVNSNLDTGAKYVEFSQAMLVVGENVPARFSYSGRNHIEELILCQRYYEQRSNLLLYFGVGVAANNIYHTDWFAVQKRATPSITFSSGTVSNITSVAIDAAELYRIVFRGICTASNTRTFIGGNNDASWTASAEL